MQPRFYHHFLTKNKECMPSDEVVEEILRLEKIQRRDTRVTPEEKRRFLARRAQETKQRRALFNAETDAEEI